MNDDHSPAEQLADIGHALGRIYESLEQMVVLMREMSERQKEEILPELKQININTAELGAVIATTL